MSTPLRELGYVEGQNLIIERKYAEGKFDRLPGLARELVQLRVDVIFAVGAAPARAAMDATATIPIVWLGSLDPVAGGLVTSLARPGGNVTGVLITPEGTLAVKKLEVLKEAVPGAIRIALLVPDDPGIGMQQQLQEVRKAASSLGVALTVVDVRGGDYDRAFITIAAARPQALLVGAHSFFVRDRKKVIELAAKYRLPAIYEWPLQVKDGGLMSYGASDVETYRQVATYIDRIFQGAKPSDLPIWQPSKLRLVINFKTAKAIGLTIPPPLLLRADEVVQ
jgi:putative ABC transport system substrate-binding protein